MNDTMKITSLREDSDPFLKIYILFDRLAMHRFLAERDQSEEEFEF